MKLLKMLSTPDNVEKSSRVLNLLDARADKDPWLNMLRGNDASARIDVSNPMQASIWVYRCISIWQWLARVPLKAEKYVSSSSQWAPSKMPEPLLILDSPRHQVTREAYFRTLIMDLAHEGEYFSLKCNVMGEPVEKDPIYLRRLNPERVTVLKEDDDERPILFQYSGKSGRAIQFSPAEVITAKFENPYSNRGLGPVDVLRMTVDSEYYGRLHQKQNVKHSGRINSVVTYDPDIVSTDEDLKKVKRWWNASKGAGNAGRDIHTTSIKDVKQLGNGTRDMDWLNGQKLNMREVLTAFQIPPTVGGDLEKATFSNRALEQKALWEDVLIPLGDVMLYTPHAQSLGVRARDVRLTGAFWEEVPALQEDIRGRVGTYKELIAGFVPPVEASRIAGLEINFIGEEAKQSWRATSLAPAKMPEPPAPVIPAPVATPEDPEDDPEPTPPPKKKKKSSGLGVSQKRLNDFISDLDEEDEPNPEEVALIKAEREDAETIQNSGLAETMRWFSRVSSKLFFDQRKAVMEQLESWEQGKDESQPNGEPPAETAPVEDQDLNSAYALAFALFVFKRKQWDGEIDERFGKVAGDSLSKHSKRVAEKYGWKEMNTVTVNELKDQQLTALHKMNSTTEGDMVKIGAIYPARIREGAMTTTQIREEMRTETSKVFNRYKRRAKNIGEIEGNASHSGAMFGTMRDNNVLTHQWFTVGDERVRDTHSGLDGVVAPLGQTFMQGITLRYPRDPLAPGAQRFGCRCVTGPRSRS